MAFFKRQTYSGQVVDFIKQSILKGELAPGEQVKEVILAERLGISRAPIREALQILAQDGLITAEPQKGKYIRIMTSQEIRDQYEVGGILEGAAISSTLSSLTDADVTRVEESLQRLRQLSQGASGLASLAAIDEEFHSTLLSHASNRQLVHLARSYCINMSKFLLLNHWDKAFTPEEFYHRHVVIFEALQTRDPMCIEHTLREHYRESGKRMSIHGSHDPHER